jgi:D123
MARHTQPHLGDDSGTRWKGCAKVELKRSKDVTFMSVTNDVDCSSASDVYLLLKFSDFITHDLDHAFDGTVDEGPAPAVRYHLVLRKALNLNPALEFRCFVRNKVLLAIS